MKRGAEPLVEAVVDEAPSPPATWFVYVVRCNDGTLYTGIATDVARRLAEHEGTTGRGAKYLRGKGPLELQLTREAGTHETALRVEHRIKRMTRTAKEELVRDAKRFDRLVQQAAGPAREDDPGN